MAKSKENVATVQITNAGQFIITIPRAIGSALELKKGRVHSPKLGYFPTYSGPFYTRPVFGE